MNRLLLWSSESDGDLRGQSRLNRGSYFFLKKKEFGFRQNLQTTPAHKSLNHHAFCSPPGHHQSGVNNKRQYTWHMWMFEFIWKTEQNCRWNVQSQGHMRNTQHRIHLLSGTGGAKTRTEITFSLPGAMERGDTAPWPQRDTGRKEGRWTGRTAGRAYRGGDRWSRSPLLSSPARRGSRAEAERHPASESD